MHITKTTRKVSRGKNPGVIIASLVNSDQNILNSHEQFYQSEYEINNRSPVLNTRDTRYQNYVSCGFWNVRGWNPDILSDSYVLRSMCTYYVNVDILGVCETHLTGDSVIELPEVRFTKKLKSVQEVLGYP